MASNDSLKQTLEHFRQQRQKKAEEMMAELRALDTTIRQIQMQLGEAPEQFDEIVSALPLQIEGNKPAAATTSGGNVKTRPDEFFGMSQGDAAKAYLEKAGHAVSLDDLVSGLKSGGCKVGGADPKKTLYISLVRNVRDFVPTGNGFIGLRKFYPNIPKLGRPKGSTQAHKAKAKSAARRKKATQTKERLLTAAPSTKVSSAEISAALVDALGDRQFKTSDELVAAVEKKLGHQVKKIAVYGTLRKKGFEQVGDKYRLRQSSEGLEVIEAVH